MARRALIGGGALGAALLVLLTLVGPAAVASTKARAAGGSAVTSGSWGVVLSKAGAAPTSGVLTLGGDDLLGLSSGIMVDLSNTGSTTLTSSSVVRASASLSGLNVIGGVGLYACQNGWDASRLCPGGATLVASSSSSPAFPSWALPAASGSKVALQVKSFSVLSLSSMTLSASVANHA